MSELPFDFTVFDGIGAAAATTNSAASAGAKRKFEAPPPTSPAPPPSVSPSPLTGTKRASSPAPTAKKPKKGGPESAAPATAAEAAIPEGPTVRECVHEVAIPEGWAEPATLAPGSGTIASPVVPPGCKPAKTWKFTLDPFQRTSVACIERRESVLVSAHTSAGKTVVAEYAIALALREGQRVIYTSPIKALSNQKVNLLFPSLFPFALPLTRDSLGWRGKYRELVEEFKDVGLMTGDITIAPHSTCLVMTTEILRSMLYRGSEVVREVAWVIFDEIHYMRNKERGVVWEETIIMLPDSVRMVFLSATIPNAKEFAQWIAQVHKQPCHVVYTDMRPVPLQHYLFPAGGEGLHLVVDERGGFRDDNFQRALAVLATPEALRGVVRGQRRTKKGSNAPDCERIVRMLMERSYQPVIVFAFSKKENESLAMQMAKLDLTTTREKEAIATIFGNAMGALTQESDRQLPQIATILPLLQRGIGIHHGGLLPILKEVIEILFQEGLVKVLFATETFSMGLNMPAKTVVFTSVRKFDGDQFRNVTPGEYIQMSGRAGRRGLDERGIVVLMIDERLEPAHIKSMVWGDPDPLNSAFFVGYSMLLNLLRVDAHGANATDPDSLVARSFRQFQSRRALPSLRERLDRAERQRAAIVVPDERLVSEYYFAKTTLAKVRSKMREITTQPYYIVSFLNPGRLVRVRDEATGADWGWCTVVNVAKKTLPAEQTISGRRRDPKEAAASGPEVVYVVEVVAECENQQADAAAPPRPRADLTADGQAHIVPVALGAIDGISAMRTRLPKDLRTRESRQQVASVAREFEKRFSASGVPTLDPVKDMHVDDEGFRKLLRQAEKLEDALASDRFAAPGLATHLEASCEALGRRLALEAEARQLRRQVREAERDVVLGAELKSMKRVLRRLGYTTAEDVIETKGRVAAELSAGDEIVITELVFSGLFNEMAPRDVAALLSCFVMEEKVRGGERLPPQKQLVEAYRQVQETARRVATVWRECKIEVDVEEYVQRFAPSLMEVIDAWCSGATFSDLMKMTEIFEGSLIRMMRRLEELLRELCHGAKSIGNAELESKFASAMTLLHKDIAFQASLYL